MSNLWKKFQWRYNVYYLTKHTWGASKSLSHVAVLDVPIIEAEQRIWNPADRVASSSLGWICGEEAPSIFQDDFRFLFQSCKIRIGLKGYECRMVP